MRQTLRRLVGRIISTLFRGRGVRRTVNGSEFRVDPRTRHVFAPDYDPEVAAFLRQRIQPGDEIWNVGANVGVYVRQIMRWLGTEGTVVAFEPNPTSAELLRSNVRLSEDPVDVVIVESAVGETSGAVKFFVSGSDGMARGGKPNPELGATETLDVSVTTLDEFAAKRGHHPRLIVMDIEGWEIGALKGGRRVLQETEAVIEMHPSAWAWSGHSRADLEAFVASERLEIVPLSGQKDPLEDYGQVLLRPMSRSESR